METLKLKHTIDSVLMHTHHNIFVLFLVSLFLSFSSMLLLALLLFYLLSFELWAAIVCIDLFTSIRRVFIYGHRLEIQLVASDSFNTFFIHIARQYHNIISWILDSNDGFSALAKRNIACHCLFDGGLRFMRLFNLRVSCIYFCSLAFSLSLFGIFSLLSLNPVASSGIKLQ